MSTKQQTHEKGTDANRDTRRTLELIRSVERNRSKVRRVREVLEGDRDPRNCKKDDWLATLEYVRDGTDTELVLYTEIDYDDYPKTVRIIALHDNGRQTIRAGWSEIGGRFASKASRREEQERFRFSTWVPTMIPLEEAKARAKAFESRYKGAQ